MLKKISHIILVVLMLISTMGMTISMHFCRHQLYDIAFFGQAKSCCCATHMETSPKGHHCHMEHDHTNDCENETIHLHKVDNFIYSDTNIHFEQVSLSTLFSFFVTLIHFDFTSTVNKVEFFNYNFSPPNVKVVLALLQTYLI